MSSRKRRAPGAAPKVQQQSGIQSTTYPPETGNMVTDQYLNNWNDASIPGEMNNAFADSSFYDYAEQLRAATAGQSNHNRIVSLDGLNDGSAASADSNPGQLVRRNPNQQLAARGSTPWDAFNNNGQQPGWEPAEEEDEELEQKAMLARKDAQSKRKQIPPFVQKLSR